MDFQKWYRFLVLRRDAYVTSANDPVCWVFDYDNGQVWYYPDPVCGSWYTYVFHEEQSNFEVLSFPNTLTQQKPLNNLKFPVL